MISKLTQCGWFQEDSASLSSNDNSDEDIIDDDNTKDNLAIHISEDYIKSLVKSLRAQKNSILQVTRLIFGVDYVILKLHYT